MLVPSCARSGFVGALVFILCAGVFAGEAAIAAESSRKIDVNLEVSVDGKVIDHPHLDAVSGEKASATVKDPHGDIVIELRASAVEGAKSMKNALMLRFVVSLMRDGKPDPIGRQHVIASSGESTEVTVHDPKSAEVIKLKVTARD